MCQRFIEMFQKLKLSIEITVEGVWIDVTDMHSFKIPILIEFMFKGAVIFSNELHWLKSYFLLDPLMEELIFCFIEEHSLKE